MDKQEPNMDGFKCFKCGEYLINCECGEQRTKRTNKQWAYDNALKEAGIDKVM